MRYLMVEKRFGAHALPPIETSDSPGFSNQPVSSSAYLNAVAECAFHFGSKASELSYVMELVILFRQTTEGHILPLRTWQRTKPGGPNVKEVGPAQSSG